MIGIILLLFLPKIATAFAGYQPVVSYFDGNTLDHACKAKLERTVVGNSGTIFSHAEYGHATYNSTKNCIISITVPVGYQIRVRVLDFDLPEPVNNNCAGATLHIFDHENTVEPHGGSDIISPGAILGQFCGRRNSSTTLAESSRNALTFWWHSGNETHRTSSNGFKLHWNAFRNDTSKFACNDVREFACSSGDECIPSDLACNWIPDCRDRSDIHVDRQIDNKCENLDFDPFSAFSGFQLLIFCVVVVILIVFAGLTLCLAVRCIKNSILRKRKLPHKAIPEAQTLKTMPDSFTPYPPSFLPPSPPKLPVEGFHHMKPQNQYLKGFPRAHPAFFDDTRPTSSADYAFVRDTHHII